MVKKYSFLERNELANKHTKFVIIYLQKQEDTFEVIDVSSDLEYQKKDIDLILIKKDKTKIMIEVKIDEKMHQTENFFLETISNHIKGTPGCFIYSEADEFYYYDVVQDILYIFNLNEARSWFKNNLEKFKEVATSTSLSNGDYYKTIGRIVQKKVFCDNVNVRIIRGIKEIQD